MAAFAVAFQLALALEAAHLAHQVVIRHVLDLRRHRLELARIFDRNEIAADEGHLAFDALLVERIGDRLDDVIGSRTVLYGNEVGPYFGLVGMQFRLLAVLHDDAGEAARVPKHRVGLLAGMRREEVRQIDHVAGALVDA